MKRCLHLKHGYCSAYFRPVLFVFLMLVSTYAPVLGSGACDHFLQYYVQLISGKHDQDTLTAETLFADLLLCHQQNQGRFDSLISPLLIWHYQFKSKVLSPGDRTKLLDTYHGILTNLQNVKPEDLAAWHALKVRVYWFRYQLDSIDYCLTAMEQLFDKVSYPVGLKVQWYYDKGRFASTIGDYASAMLFYRRGLEYLEAYFPNEKTRYYLLNALGIGYRRSGNSAAAILHYEKILEDLKPELNDMRLTGTCLNNLGLSYKDHGAYDKAIPHLKQAIAYYEKHFTTSYADIGSGYDNIALCYEAKGDLDSALYFSKKSYAFVVANYGEDHPDVLLPMNSMTGTLIKKGLLHDANKINNKAKDLLVQYGWSESEPGGDYYFLDGLDIFTMGMLLHRNFYDQTLEAAQLENAIADGRRFMSMTDYAYDNLKNEISKDVFQKTYREVYSYCVDNLYEKYDQSGDVQFADLAFQYTEKFKSLELLYASQKDKAENVPRHKKLNDQYKILNDSIQYYERLLYKNKNESLGVRYVSRLNLLKEQLYTWKEGIRKNHPKYYALIYHPEPITLQKLKTSLTDRDQCILSYHVADSAAYMFVVSADTVHFVKQNFDYSLPEYIECYREAIFGFHASNSISEEAYLALANIFVDYGFQLYNTLIAPVSTVLKDRVTIIVDKSLGYLPFEILVSNKPNKAYQFRDHHFLLLDHAISYSYSARLWLEMQNPEKSYSGKVLAIAPSFPEDQTYFSIASALRSGLTKLYYNESEVNQITSILPGKALKGKQATKENFIRYSPDYAIIHLATHGKANDEQSDFSFLSFTDTQTGNPTLSTSEIYLLNLNADLVTLSACETGLGALRSGEGIISIARAFSFAGAKSIVSTLWSVNDKSTSGIMARFYTYIKQGESKDIALQKAKVDYLQSHGHVDANPFYWGGFICVGDMQQIAISATWVNYLIPAVLFLIALLIVIFFRKNLFRLGT